MDIKPNEAKLLKMSISAGLDPGINFLFHGQGVKLEGEHSDYRKHSGFVV